MISIMHYQSPVGKMLLASENNQLIGLWLAGQKYYMDKLTGQIREKEEEILVKTKKWLDSYFKEERPEIKDLRLAPIGSEFRKTVWQLLCEIPYGEVMTYGELAKKVAKKMKQETMSAQAIGGAVGHNPISVIIPCHRVVGSKGSLTGYAGGIDKKIKLLELEKVDMQNLFLPKDVTAVSSDK